MTTTKHTLSQRDIFNFWAPLSLTWMMMSIEGPVLNAVIARMINPEINLAAYGTATGLAMLIESPVIMLLSTTIAMVKNKQSFDVMYRYMMITNLLVTVLTAMCLIPPVFDFIAFTLYDLPADVAHHMYVGLSYLVFWSACIGYRRFFQGLLIKNGKTRLVAIGTIARIVAMAMCSLMLMKLQVEGIVAGCASLAIAVFLESIATRFMAHKTAVKVQAIVNIDYTISNSSIFSFHLPLALTTLLGMAVTPFLTFFITKSNYVIESLAVLPVIDSFVFLFRSFGFSYQEACIALLGDNNKHYKSLRSFGFKMIIYSTLALVIVAFTPIAHWVYNSVYGLSEQLSSFSILPTQILVLLPTLSVLYSYQRGLLINKRNTTEVTISTVVEVSLIISILALLVFTTHPNGAVAASIAMVIGRVFANVYLHRKSRLVVPKFASADGLNA